MKTIVSLIALVTFCSFPNVCSGQNYGANCLDPTFCLPATVPVTVTVRRAYGVTRSVDFDYEIFGIGWEDRADLFARVTINGEVNDAPPSGQVDGTDHPEFTNWPITVDVPADLRVVDITVELWEVDPVSPNDPVDISSNPGAESVSFSFDLCSGEVFRPDLLGGPVVARSGGIITVSGDDSDLDAEDRADLELTIETPTLKPAQEFCDLQITACDLVQTLRDLPFVLADRQAVMRVRVASTFNTDVTTEIECHVNDLINPEVIRTYPITVPACQTVDTFFLVEDPVEIPRGGNLVIYGAIVDPNGDYHTPNLPECMITNDGSHAYGTKQIHAAPDLTVKMVRYRTDVGDGAISEAEMNDAADATQLWVDRLFPIAGRVIIRRDPDVLEYGPGGGSGPWLEIAFWSTNFLVTQGRVIGLVGQGYLDSQGYSVFPDGRTGASLGKMAPAFAIAEIGWNEGSTPAHELCHTYGLSEEPCDGPFLTTLWECEDEYNRGNFPDGPFMGAGYDFFGPTPGPFSGFCIMDNESPPWISATDYSALLRGLRGEADPRVLIVRGKVDAKGNGQLDAAHGLAEGTPDRVRRDRTPFSLVVLDDARTVLGEYGVMPPTPARAFADNDGPDLIPGAIDQDGDCDLDPLDEDDNDEQDSLDDDGLPDGDQDQNCIPDCFPVPHMDSCLDEMWFSLAIPWPANGVAVELRGPSGDVIAGLPIDELPVPIELREPLGDILVDPHEPVVVRWAFGLKTGSRTAPQGAPNRVLVAASYDGGQSWFPRAVVDDAEQYIISNDGLESPVTMRVRVYSLQNGMTASSTGDQPTATLLQAFRAASSPDGVVLTWSLSGEPRFVGYLIDRSDGAGNRVRLTSSPVPAGGVGAELRFVDSSALPGEGYAYTLLGLESSGEESYLGQTSLRVPGAVPLQYALGLNSPNPFSGTTRIRFDLPERSRVTLGVFDIAGRPVASLADGEWDPGSHVAVWSGAQTGGGLAPAGVYIVRMTATSSSSDRRFESLRKIALVR